MRAPQAARLCELLLGDGVTVTSSEPGVLDVEGLDTAEIGERAAAAGVVLHELSPQEASLEEAFMAMTHVAVEYHATSELATTGGTSR